MHVPKHWGNAGRINVIGTLSCNKNKQHLEYQLLGGSCKAEQVEHYLEALARQAQNLKIKVVVLDNAGTHKAKRIKQQLERWQAMGLTLWFQPPYSPQFNLIETVWKKLKSFLLPRRCYKNRDDLMLALLDVLNLMNAVNMAIPNS
jgi:putative transposase